MGETLVLECSVTNLLLPPSKLSWSHVRERSSGGGREVSADFKRGVSLESERLAGESHTRMVVSSVRPGDAGTYLCQAGSTANITLVYFGSFQKRYFIHTRNYGPSGLRCSLRLQGDIDIMYRFWPPKFEQRENQKHDIKQKGQKIFPVPVT